MTDNVEVQVLLPDGLPLPPAAASAPRTSCRLVYISSTSGEQQIACVDHVVREMIERSAAEVQALGAKPRPRRTRDDAAGWLGS